MNLTGAGRFVDRMVLQSGTRATYTLHRGVMNYPYGFSGIGVLIRGGQPMNVMKDSEGRVGVDDDGDGRVDEDEREPRPPAPPGQDQDQVNDDGDGQFNEDPSWPYCLRDRARTAIAWDDRGHFYLIVFEGDSNRGVTWQETVDFFRTELPRWMREKLPSFVANEPAYEGARVSPQVITIQDAIMLDGGGSTQFIWIWAQRRRQRDGSWVPPIIRPAPRGYTVEGRRVPTLVDVYAVAP